MDKVERISWIDTTRGIAILLVVFGHCMGYIDNPINKVILSFHMPLFFFLSGCCAKRKTDIAAFLKSKIRKLLPGQLFLATTCVIYDFFAVGKLSIISNLFIWFLPVLFYTEIVFQIATDRTRPVFLGIAVVMILVLTQSRIHTIVHLEIVPMAFAFYVAGYYIMGGVKQQKTTKAIPMRTLIILVPALLVFSLCNEPVLMYENTYGKLFLFFPSAIIGIFTACVLGNALKNSKLLTWAGQKSLLLYILHFKLTGIIHYGAKHIAGMNLDLYSSPHYYVVFFLEVVILYVMVKVIDRVRQPRLIYRK